MYEFSWDYINFKQTIPEVKIAHLASIIAIALSAVYDGKRLHKGWLAIAKLKPLVKRKYFRPMRRLDFQEFK